LHKLRDLAAHFVEGSSDGVNQRCFTNIVLHNTAIEFDV
jgi:hypothetical protein